MRKQALKEVQKLHNYTPNDMFKQTDILELINELSHPRDKAMVALQYDGALRPHELLKLRLNDIMFHEKYAQVTVAEDTKTG